MDRMSLNRRNPEELLPLIQSVMIEFCNPQLEIMNWTIYCCNNKVICSTQRIQILVFLHEKFPVKETSLFGNINWAPELGCSLSKTKTKAVFDWIIPLNVGLFEN